MRPIKQAGVVSTHTLLFFAPAAASLSVGASLMLLHVTREAFLFVSACMLTYSYRGLKDGGLSAFYRRRFVAVGIPYLCWTLIYFLVTLPDHSMGVGGSLVHLAYLAGTGYYQLYYLLVIMQFYLVFPLVAALIGRARHHGLVLAISGAVQLAVVSLEHWTMLPSAFEGFWATRDIISYQFYLLAGMIVALHLQDVHAWLAAHVRLVIGFTLAAAAMAEGWYYLAATGFSHWLGSSSDAFQPIVIPFNIGAIACLYLAGMALVDRRRSHTVRAMVRSGSDNSYGVYLAQMLFIIALNWVGWGRLADVVPWPPLIVGTVVIVFSGCVLLTSLMARTSLAKALTGRSRAPWATWLPGRSPLPLGAEET